MKTILLHKSDGQYVAAGGADSAVLRPGEPVFVPDPVEDWRASIAPAIRIDRLGLNIKTAFASKHYSEISLLHLMLPVGACPVPPLFCDRAISPGVWTPADIGEIDIAADILGSDDSIMAQKMLAVKMSALEADEAVHFVSQYMTLKTGDMIIFGDHAIDLGTPRLDTRLTASLNGTAVLDIRYK